MEWKWCIGFEGLYEVSDAGLVRSYIGQGAHKIIANPTLLKPTLLPIGYYSVQLRRGNRRYVHRLVVESFIGIIPPGMDVDHVNRDSTDNRLENLRVVTRGSNNHNTRKTWGRSAYRGVFIHLRNPDGSPRVWRAKIMVEGKTIHCGCFATEEEAAMARDAMAVKLLGDNVALNFPHQTENLQ